MAFPYTHHSNLEAGTTAEWASGETDTGSRASVMHYSAMRRLHRNLAPYRGAYAWVIDLNGTADAYLLDAATAVQSDATTAYYSFNFFITAGATVDNNERIELMEAHSAGATELVISLLYTTAAGWAIGAVETNATALTNKTTTVTTGQWHHIEVKFHDHSDGSGTIDSYLDGVNFGTQSATLTGAAITNVHWGVLNQGAVGTGYIALDNFVLDDGQVYPMLDRFPYHVPVQKSTHVFIGPGHVQSVTLMSVAATDKIILYDTDRAEGATSCAKLVEVSTAANSSAEGPWYFNHGCYAVLSGTNPEGVVDLVQSTNLPGVCGPLYYSAWGYRQYERG